jgi:hypothetical protein
LGSEKTHEEKYMRKTTSLGLGALVVGVAALLAFSPIELNSQPSASVSIDQDDIGGVVTSAKGPEAGVWVIAETKDLPTRFAKMVVTDERGRYVIPDLPKANFDIWVRGYGLVDSPLEWRPRSLAERERQGFQVARRAFPVAPRSVGEIVNSRAIAGAAF